MLIWLINKKEKTISLLGHYDEKYFHRKGKDKVGMDNCNDILDSEEYNWFFEKLLINPVKNYVFKVNNELKRKNFFYLGNFPYTYYGEVYFVNETTGKWDTGDTESTSQEIAFLENLFHAFGYETDCRRLGTINEMEEYMSEKGFKPAYFYGLGRGCCLFVKEKI